RHRILSARSENRRQRPGLRGLLRAPVSKAGPAVDQRVANLPAILESLPRIHDRLDAGQAVDRQHAAIGIGNQPRPRAVFRAPSFARGKRVSVLAFRGIGDSNGRRRWRVADGGLRSWTRYANPTDQANS